MKDFFLIANIISLFGKNGFVKIELYSDFPQRFVELEKLFIDFWGDKKIFYVEDVKELNNAVALKFKNFDDKRNAGVLVGRGIYVEEKDLIKLPDDTYYIHDLIGSKVLQGGKNIGTIADVISPPANDVIIIRNEKSKELLIPLVLDFIESFDPESKILILKQNIDYDDED